MNPTTVFWRRKPTKMSLLWSVNWRWPGLAVGPGLPDPEPRLTFGRCPSARHLSGRYAYRDGAEAQGYRKPDSGGGRRTC